MGWSRREPDTLANISSSTPILSKLQSLNPFGDAGYVRLPTQEGPGAPLPAPSRREEEEGWFALSRWDRLLVFGACNAAALVCFVICFALFPVLSLKPRKFAILYVFPFPNPPECYLSASAWPGGDQHDLRHAHLSLFHPPTRAERNRPRLEPREMAAD
ncbi:MAG: hypothetical protein Q9213_002354 [Squamulea squamosa]